MNDVDAKAVRIVLCSWKLGVELHDLSSALVKVLVNFAKITDLLDVSILTHVKIQTAKKIKFSGALKLIKKN